MNNKAVIEHIVNWLKSYCESSRTEGFVIGISGGIDSALTSTLCAMTGKKVVLLEMPIYQAASQVSRAQEHIAWVKSKFPQASDYRVELTSTFDAFLAAVPATTDEHTLHLSLANTRARIRMTTLYYFAGIHRLLVAGTGNKIEDFGVGFFTKYGDGGVDLSPIADLTKTEVYALAHQLGVVESIQKAAPTDGLWGDDRTDEDQIGASYPELEWAMALCERFDYHHQHWIEENDGWRLDGHPLVITTRQKNALDIYVRMNKANQHKMQPIPVCLIPPELKMVER
ncbi:MAG: NAD(+) synthase [Flavobacteriales bacterium]|nr:NAD(+) synthase [Flavobacteriales bacterium]